MLVNRVRAEEKMDKNGLEALIATSPANVFYFSDCYPYGRCFALLPRDRNIEPALVAPISGSTPIVLMSPPWFSDVRYYGEFYMYTQFIDHPVDASEERLVKAVENWEHTKQLAPEKILSDLIREKGFEGKIGIDESGLKYDDTLIRDLTTSNPDVELIPANKVIREIRMVKTREEVKRIEKAIKITENAWETSLDNIEEGMREIEFAEIFQQTILKNRGHNFSYLGTYWPPIAFGRRTAFSDIAQPTNYQLKKGDMIRFDGGCTYQGYPCDMARVASYGKPSEKLQSYWEAIYAGEQAAIELVEPGVKASGLFETAVKTVKDAGIKHYRRHHAGHGWGVEGYDPPTVGPETEIKLEAGMVMCFETPYYEVGWGGILHEDVILVTENGYKYLTKPESTLRII
jgi:Xaa-Pro aminopeptidase